MTEGKAMAFRWTGEALLLLDQRRLPHEEVWVTCTTPEEVAEAIRKMVIRGAPAIGVAAAFGMVLAAKQALRQARPFKEALREAKEVLAASRPTAVNLFWALGRMMKVAETATACATCDLVAAIEREAIAIFEGDYEANRRMGELGAALLPFGSRVLTHCNTGALATSGWGTALGVIRTAYQQGKVRLVWVNETRPFLQGARLTMWELLRDGIPAKLIVDGAGAWLMQKGLVDAVIVGADRITRNGDVANKVGTYMLALCAHRHGIPFYVAAPLSTIDPNLPDGKAIPIEERDEREVLDLAWQGIPVTPKEASAFNPAFDVTPAELVTAIITEGGVLHPPFEESIPCALGETSVAGEPTKIKHILGQKT